MDTPLNRAVDGAPAAPERSEAEGERSAGAAGARAPVPTPGPFPTPTPTRPARRRFPLAKKREILRRAAACTGKGELGALLRREGIYSSHLSTWRKQIDALEEKALTPKRRGPKPEPLRAENAKLMRENERLRKKLAHTQDLLELQKKVFRLLEKGEPEPSESA